jgi:hypothetical protein
MKPIGTAALVLLAWHLAGPAAAGQTRAAREAGQKATRGHSAGTGRSRLGLDDTRMSPVPPGANLAAGPPPAAPPRAVTEKWWFWAAVGGVVVTAVAVVLIAGRAPSPPGSTLGNMDVFGGH